MPDIRSILIYGLGACLALVLAWGGSKTMALNTERAAHSKTKQDHAEVLRDLADRTARAAGAALVTQQAMNRLASEADRKITKGMNDALADNERRRAADTGSRGLRIAATCPAPSSGDGVPIPAQSPSMDPGTVEIAPEVRRAIWDFRAELIKDLAKLEYLQSREESPD